jgi:hypothetical protein
VAPQLADGGAATDYPRVDFGPLILAPWDTFDAKGMDFTIRLHVRWRGGSLEPGLAMQHAIYERLHRGDLTLDGWYLVKLDRESSSVTRLDGSFDGICEYRGLIAEN